MLAINIPGVLCLIQINNHKYNSDIYVALFQHSLLTALHKKFLKTVFRFTLIQQLSQMLMSDAAVAHSTDLGLPRCKLCHPVMPCVKINCVRWKATNVQHIQQLF